MHKAFDLKNLEKRLQKLSSIAIAFSGGVDSSFLLAVAKKAKVKKLIAITINSQFVPTFEIECAKKIADSMKVEHICIDVDILENKNVIRNDIRRCYYCKKKMFSSIKKIADNLNFKFLLHAINIDDLNDYRPGIDAARELGFLSPLVDEKFTKKKIRKASKQLKLKTWNKVAQSCLATRIAKKEKITNKKLVMVEKAEQFLHKLDKSLDFKLYPLRVRSKNKIARIEVEPKFIQKISSLDIRQKILQKFTKIGFQKVSIDIDGYQSKISRSLKK